jgi:lipid-A-disaccharide synthase
MPYDGTSPPSILFIAGDVSGDVHAAALARALLAHDPSRAIHALGGKRLREAVAQSPGGVFLADTSDSSAIGVVSALLIYFHCRRLRGRLREFLARHHVDLVILCDWGGFNRRIIAELHGRGLRIFYYFPPASWQRSGTRALCIVPYVSGVATPFAWSAERLRAAGARAEWVGHPSLEYSGTMEERSAARRRYANGPNEKVIALLPGSRLTELKVLGPRMAQTISLIQREMDARFIAAIPRELAAQARRYLPDEVEIVSDQTREILLAADAAIIKTGTGTLEGALAGTPQVTIYDVSLIGRIEWCVLWSWRWWRIRFIAMPNIILQRPVVPELIGLNCRPEKIARELLRLLQDDQARRRMLADYALIAQALGSELPISATERTAQMVEETLSEITGRTVPEPARV